MVKQLQKQKIFSTICYDRAAKKRPALWKHIFLDLDFYLDSH